MSKIRIVLDEVETARTYFVMSLTFVWMKVYGLETTWDDVVQGKYGQSKHTDLVLNDSTAIDEILAHAKNRLTDSKKRQAESLEKSKNLLAISSLLFGLIGTFLPQASAFGSTFFKLAFFVGMILLLNVVFLVLVSFGVGKYMEVTIDQEEANLPEPELKAVLVNSSHACASDNENRTDFLVDIYRTTRSLFLVAFVLFGLLFTVNLFSSAPETTTEDLVRSIRDDPDLVELLRGPRGKSGADGQNGPQGNRGLTGDKGQNGNDAVVNKEQIVDGVFSDSRLRQIIELAIEKQSRLKE